MSRAPLQIYFPEGDLIFSARRVFDHIAFAQINPFRPINRPDRIRAENYIDIVDAGGIEARLTGYTLADLIDGNAPYLQRDHDCLLKYVARQSTQAWISRVSLLVSTFGVRRGLRNTPGKFLSQETGTPLNVSGLRCALQKWVDAHRADKAPADEWIRRIQNLGGSGLRSDELRSTNIERVLRRYGKLTRDGGQVYRLLRYGYDRVRLSVIPAVAYAKSNIRFRELTDAPVVKRYLRTLRHKALTRPEWRDPVLGYSIDGIHISDLFGDQHVWFAFTADGELLTSDECPDGYCRTPKMAMRMADRNAARILPRLNTDGTWSDYRTTGGDQYREWLVTLPYYPASFSSAHFDQRNVLLHIRSDIQLSSTGERVLLLHEVQSDWARRALRRYQPPGQVTSPVPEPPWLQEWPALALKLMLLHAVEYRLDALAWVSGKAQTDTYGGRVSAYVTELYDRRLPRELNRLLRKYHRAHEPIVISELSNYQIDISDMGYVVRNHRGEDIYLAQSWVEARRNLPDDARMVETPVCGIRLTEDLRRAITANGFFAWGNGISS